MVDFEQKISVQELSPTYTNDSFLESKPETFGTNRSKIIGNISGILVYIGPDQCVRCKVRLTGKAFVEWDIENYAWSFYSLIGQGFAAADGRVTDDQICR